MHTSRVETVERSPSQLTYEQWFADRSLPVATRHEIPQSEMPLHTHEFSEIVLIERGEGVHITDGDSYLLTAGDIFVVHGQDAHGYQNVHDLVLTNVMFDPELLRVPAPRSDLRHMPGFHALFRLEPEYRSEFSAACRLSLNPVDLTGILEHVASIDEELSTQRDGYRFMAVAHFMFLVGELSRLYSEQPPTESEPLLRIARAFSHMEQHYFEPIRIRDLCEIASISESSLTRAFRRVCGQSPIDYLISLRVKHSCELLRTSTMAVTDIAYEVGFNDANYFIRKFRDLMGVTPGRWRR